MSTDLLALLDRPPPIKIVDVGAMDLGETPFARLLEIPGASIVGFEPNPVECARLNEARSENRRYLPHFIGDGTKRTFHWCEWAATSSLYPPNRRVLDRFTDLSALVRLKGTEEVQTTRLDDIPEVVGADFIKVDVQGAALDVLRGGADTVSRALVVECEVEFVPLYEGEPLFAEVDLEMRRRGFLFHKFKGLASRTFAPLKRRPDAPAVGQVLWTDAIYVRSFLDFGSLEPSELLKVALILEREYASRDLALHALQHHDEKTNAGLWERYVATLTSAIKEKPPLG